MQFWKSSSIVAPLVLTPLVPAQATCQFSPFSFFPVRNDEVQIRVTTQSGHSCTMAFKEGPGYKFTSASFLKAPRTASWPRPARPNSCICLSRAIRAMIATRLRYARSCRGAAAARLSPMWWMRDNASGRRFLHAGSAANPCVVPDRRMPYASSWRFSPFRRLATAHEGGDLARVREAMKLGNKRLPERT